MDVLKYIVTFILIVTLLPTLLKMRGKTGLKILIFSLSLILISSFFPIYPTNGSVDHLESILDFIIKGNLAFIAMFGAYLLTLILLVIPGHKFNKIALGVYIIGFIATCIGIFQFSGPYLVYPYSTYGNSVWLMSYLWLTLYILIPGINFLFFMPLVISAKLMKQAYSQKR